MIFEHNNLTDEQKWAIIKNDRNALLLASDWTQVLDAPLTIEQRTAWSAYRQSLRDIPQEFDNPDYVVFPEAPDA